MFLTRVGESSVTIPNCPYGNNPDLINAWNPLQIPKINPSRSNNPSILSRTCSFIKTDVINFPDPSGSSPALNPPDSIKI